MRTAIFRLAAIFALVMGALVFGTAASADNTNPNGATVIDVKPYCFVTQGYTVCLSDHEVYNRTTTPSGNINYINNGTVTSTVTSPGGTEVDSATSKTHEHDLFMNGVLQEDTYTDCYTETITFSGTTYTYGYSVRYHYANGQLQYIDFGSGC